jgi:hypothetical protein
MLQILLLISKIIEYFSMLQIFYTYTSHLIFSNTHSKPLFISIDLLHYYLYLFLSLKVYAIIWCIMCPPNIFLFKMRIGTQIDIIQPTFSTTS